MAAGKGLSVSREIGGWAGPLTKRKSKGLGAGLPTGAQRGLARNIPVIWNWAQHARVHHVVTVSPAPGPDSAATQACVEQ